MAYSANLQLVVGDTLPELTFTLKDSNTAASGKTLDPEDETTWSAVDLTGDSVRLRIRKIGSTTVTSNIPATISDPTNGVCIVQFPTGTWTEAGNFEGELEHTTSSGGIQTVNELIKFKIRDDFD